MAIELDDGSLLMEAAVVRPTLGGVFMGRVAIALLVGIVLGVVASGLFLQTQVSNVERSAFSGTCGCKEAVDSLLVQVAEVRALLSSPGRESRSTESALPELTRPPMSRDSVVQTTPLIEEQALVRMLATLWRTSIDDELGIRDAPRESGKSPFDVGVDELVRAAFNKGVALDEDYENGRRLARESFGLPKNYPDAVKDATAGPDREEAIRRIREFEEKVRQLHDARYDARKAVLADLKARLASS
jgi:hypothetical protein